MNHTLRAASLAATLTLLSTPAWCGGNHAHKPAHAGVAIQSAGLNLELVAKSDLLTLYVTDHGKPVAVTGGHASATIYSSSGKTEITLRPTGENKLTANGDFKTGLGVRVAVVLNLPNKGEIKGNFRLK